MKHTRITRGMGSWDLNVFRKYSKQRQQYQLSPKGRWGPAWLHKLIFRVARNCGMVGHPTDVDETRTVAFNELRCDDPKLTTLVREALLNYDRLDLRDPPCIYVGPDAFETTLTELGDNFMAYARVDLHKPTPFGVDRLWGVPIMATPCISGVVVVPKQRGD